jgi:ATP-dependent Clp protease ATP-binding subunit ClpA
VTQQSRSYLFYASEEVGALGHRQIELEHLLLALLSVDSDVALSALGALTLRAEQWRETLKGLYPRSPAVRRVYRVAWGPHIVPCAAAVRRVMQHLRDASRGSERRRDELEAMLLLRLMLESPEFSERALPVADRQRWLRAVAD